jgi:hypothetical protein
MFFVMSRLSASIKRDDEMSTVYAIAACNNGNVLNGSAKHFVVLLSFHCGANGKLIVHLYRLLPSPEKRAPAAHLTIRGWLRDIVATECAACEVTP